MRKSGKSSINDGLNAKIIERDEILNGKFSGTPCLSEGRLRRTRPMNMFMVLVLDAPISYAPLDIFVNQLPTENRKTLHCPAEKKSKNMLPLE